MSDSLTVILDEAVAGTITRLRGGRLRFDYEDAYRNAASTTPISVAMPKAVSSHSERIIAPWLRGLLPDNEAVLARWARDFHSAASPFALLSTPIGHDCAGAVRFAAPGLLEELIGQPGTVQWLSGHDAAVIRLLGAPLIEQNDEWLVSRRYLSAESMSLLNAPEGLHAVQEQAGPHTPGKEEKVTQLQAG